MWVALANSVGSALETDVWEYLAIAATLKLTSFGVASELNSKEFPPCGNKLKAFSECTVAGLVLLKAHRPWPPGYPPPSRECICKMRT